MEDSFEEVRSYRKIKNEQSWTTSFYNRWHELTRYRTASPQDPRS